MNARLTQEDINKLAGALHRLKELDAKQIIESTDAAEKRGLQNFLAAESPKFLEEFIACWITVQQEYRPLIQGFTGLFRHAVTLIDRAQPQQEAKANG